LNVICEALAKLFELEMSVDDMSLMIVVALVTSLENLRLVEEN